MIVTRKALVGFILLAIIVYGTTQFTITHMHGPPSNNNVMTGKSEPMTPNVLKHEPTSYMSYRHPIIPLGNYAPLAVTAIIELFTLGCYILLKKYEPVINEAAEEIISHYK
jgi:hypothetical protein